MNKHIWTSEDIYPCTQHQNIFQLITVLFGENVYLQLHMKMKIEIKCLRKLN